MSLLTSTKTSFENKLTDYLNTAKWRVKVAFWGMLIAVLSSFNNFAPLQGFKDYFTNVINGTEYFAYQDALNRASNWRKIWVYPAGTGLNNRTFRMTQGFFVKVFHLYPATVWLYSIQLVLGFTFFYLIATFVFRRFGDKLAALYLVAGIACIYPGTSFFIDYSGYGDFFSYFFLFLAIYFRNPLFIFGALQCAFWNDERAVVASGLVFVWWWLVPLYDANKGLKIIINKQLVAVFLAWIAYFGIRYGVLIHYVGMHDTYTPDEFMINFKANGIAYGFKYFWSIEGFWFLIFWMYYAMISQKDYLRMLLILGASLLILLLGITIFDTTRSTSYVYLVIFLALVITRKTLTEKQFRDFLLLIALLCFLHPLATKTNAMGMFLM